MPLNLTKSECLGNWLHRWKLKQDNENGFLEICSICGEKHYQPKAKGTIDNIEYLETHLRETLQFYMPRFNKEYGK